MRMCMGVNDYDIAIDIAIDIKSLAPFKSVFVGVCMWERNEDVIPLLLLRERVHPHLFYSFSSGVVCTCM